jgi:uncharacterized protein
LSATAKLSICVSEIPASGLVVACPLDSELVRLDGHEGFELRSGGSLNCRVERGDGETVHVQGRLEARLTLECGRCLERFDLLVEQRLDLFYLPHQEGLPSDEDEDELEISEHDLVVAYYDEGYVDLAELIREQLLLSVPMKRLCREDCQGICPSCGANRNSQRCSCQGEVDVDPRLLPLKQLLERRRR